jgi:hypothetical protein
MRSKHRDCFVFFLPSANKTRNDGYLTSFIPKSPLSILNSQFSISNVIANLIFDEGKKASEAILKFETQLH